MRRVTFCVESDESRSLCAQSVTFCAKCSAVCRTARAGRGLVAVGGVAAGGAGGGALPGILPSATVGGQGGVCWWCGLSGSGVVLHIHSEVLAGVVAWFQRFPGPGDVREQDECATAPALHIHPASRVRADRRIRVVLPFTDRGL